MRALLDEAPETNIDEMDWASWIGDAIAVDEGDDEYSRRLARDMAELQQAAETQLTDIKVFDVGAEPSGDGVRPLYIPGKTACGNWAGYKTIIVAT